jgi:ElaB/YqjD/DUF883 family membrane-anchored ribosome-binding protein
MANEDTCKPVDTAEANQAQPAGKNAESAHDVNCAAEAVRRAEAELKKARELYEAARGKAVERIKAVREKKMGELIDGTLHQVQKHPAYGVCVAAMIGFFLGRLFKR